MRVLVTGANGFVGRAVLRLGDPPSPFECVAAVRRPVIDMPSRIRVVRVGDLGDATDWRHALDGIDSVVHTAARVHVLREGASTSVTDYRLVNVDGTLRLAMEAVKAGVRRLVFISSIKVNGGSTVVGRPFIATDDPSPADAYGASKCEAEIGLREISKDTGLEIVIIRPVLVYGPGVAGNFRSMMRWLHRGTPLPFGGVDNRRSLVAIDNLVDLIGVAIVHPLAANRTLLVSDGCGISTPELLSKTAVALGTRARLLPVPPSVLRLGARVLGRGREISRLCESLEVDISTTRELLGWTPRIDIDEALSRTARHFLGAVGR